jgi:septal ring factor EnvC (AmiA/AmiB activator)
MRIEFVNEHMGPDETIPLDEQAMEQPEHPTPNHQREMNTLRELLNETETEIAQVETQIRELRPEITNVPTMRA